MPTSVVFPISVHQKQDYTELGWLGSAEVNKKPVKSHDGVKIKYNFKSAI